MNPGPEDLWFLPLGGCGEIGMNMNLYGHDGQWLMVDCGVTFADPGESGPHVQMPDPAFAQAHKPIALLITHAHEDHVGAVAHLWREFNCPVYAAPFTAAVLRRKLAEVGLLDRVPLHIVEAGTRHQLGGFDIEWLGITHSTPDSFSLVIRTAAGAVFHTGDWKADDEPVVGQSFDAQQFKDLAADDVLAMVCDSTNAEVPGRSQSEGALHAGLQQMISDARGRVVVTCFGSNVARLHTLAQVAQEVGRYAGLLGRSLHNYHRAAVEAALWDPALKFVDAKDLGYLPRSEVLAIATGSQGEPRAALHRLAANNHPDLNLEPGDTLLMSSRVIPGNEAAVELLLRRLETLGVHIVRDEALNLPIHASGHPCRDELADLYAWVQPRCAIPVHGEADHMRANAAIAKEVGVPAQVCGQNGDLFMLAPVRGVRRNFAPVGRLGLHNGRLVPVA